MFNGTLVEVTWIDVLSEKKDAENKFLVQTKEIK